jgi:hypothetical protein
LSQARQKSLKQFMMMDEVGEDVWSSEQIRMLIITSTLGARGVMLV